MGFKAWLMERKCVMTREVLRRQLINMYSEGKSVDEICAEHNVPKSTFYRWIRKSRSVQPEISEEDVRTIISRIEELEEETMTYKKNPSAAEKSREINIKKRESMGW